MTQTESFSAWLGWPAEWRAELDKWEMVPLEIDGEVAGLAAVDGTEIHFALSPDWRGKAITRARTRDFFTPLMARRGYLTTRTMDARPEQVDFITRLGFRHTWTQDGIGHYMMTCLPFDKRN